MYVIKAHLCFAILTLVNSRGTPPVFENPQGNRWPKRTEYIKRSESKSIGCYAKASPPARYYWTVNGTDITWDKSILTFDASNGTLTTGPKFGASHSGEYQCTAYNDYGKLMTPLLNIILAVHEGFIGSVETLREEVYESKYIKLDCEGVRENIPRPQFSWFRGTTNEPGDFKEFPVGERIIVDHKGSLHFLWTERGDNYTYTCATYNTVYLSTKRNPRIIKLTVKQPESKYNRVPELMYSQDVEVYAGQTAVLMCIFTYYSNSGVKLEVNWRFRGNLVHKGATYTIQNVQLSDIHELEGEYQCEAVLGTTRTFGRVNLKIVGPPAFIPGYSPSTNYVTVGQNLTIECRTNSYNSYIYPPAWFEDGKSLIGCPKYYFECRNRKPDGSSICILEKLLCDKTHNCADGSDEDNCLGPCPPSQQRCGDNCISASASCLPTCNYPDFLCRNKRGCLTSNKLCDGAFDCRDGSDERVCPGKEPFHVNGVYIDSNRTQLTIPNVRLRETMCYQCMVRNDYGSVLGGACITVIEKIRVLKKPSSTYNVEPGSELQINVDATTDEMWQKQLEYVWQWYEEKTDKKTGTQFTEPVTLPPGGRIADFFHVSNRGRNLTIVFPELKKEEDGGVIYETLTNRLYTLIIRHRYDSVEFNFTIYGPGGGKAASVVKAASTSLWFIAVILGVLLLFVIIALFICYMYRNRGGTYPVDEKEKKAGNNPEQELKDGGLHDVGRVIDDDGGFADRTDKPDGPRTDQASLSESVKPYESDDDPTEEYGGEFDVSKFNEDGSFIGTYIDKDHRDGPREVTV